jgi:hypothetical protein
MCVKHFAAKRRRHEKLEYCLLKDNILLANNISKELVQGMKHATAGSE